jgi:hypothetical protein
VSNSTAAAVSKVRPVVRVCWKSVGGFSLAEGDVDDAVREAAHELIAVKAQTRELGTGTPQLPEKVSPATGACRTDRSLPD